MSRESPIGQVGSGGRTLVGGSFHHRIGTRGPGRQGRQGRQGRLVGPVAPVGLVGSGRGARA
eukprot:4383519-Pyramimonas_sp.AAC.1